MYILTYLDENKLVDMYGEHERIFKLSDNGRISYELGVWEVHGRFFFLIFMH